ncbi:MAG TPA: amino acid adenylation domain-containing protein [Longimicrobium sp.]|nr:amino acid adenylation domain-containing protein [Longimicrobium sp.]
MSITAPEGAEEATETFAFPMTFQQQRLWFLEQYEPDTALYNIPGGARILGALDEAAFARAVDEIVARHEVLRTVFRSVDGEPMQVVGAGALPRLEVRDRSHVSPEAREADARALFEEEARRPFDIARGPLLRVVLGRYEAHDHAFVICLHHIVGDGWSMGVLNRELMTLYGAFVRGEPSPLPDLPLQYADVAVWQRETLEGEALEAELAWWKERLAGAPAVLDLPTDRPRPARQSHEGSVFVSYFPPELLARAREAARREDATLYMLLLAVLDVLLWRYTGARDLLVGTPVANRTEAETEVLIGLFANTLVLRTRVDGALPFRELVGRVREASLAAHDHQDIPFEKLVEELGTERDLSRPPLFQVMFILQNHTAPLPMTDLFQGVRTIVGGNETSKFDLTFIGGERLDGTLMLAIEYPTALFDRATAERMAAHFRTVLEAACERPDTPVGALPLMPEAERAAVLETWNATARDYPAGLVHERVSAQAAATPGAVAVVGPHGTLTYGELEARSNRLARYLRSLGVGPGVLVGVAVERSAGMVAALLGVLKAGGAYVPVDPDFPADRVSYMLADAGAPVLLTQSSLAGRFRVAEGAAVVRIDTDADLMSAFSAEPFPSGATEDDLAYVIYTSGSTGRPKGVQVRHGGVASFLRSMAEAPGLKPCDSLVAVTTLSFDIAVLELFLPLAVGAKTVVATREQAGDPAQLRALMEKAGATVMQATPATWRMLVASGWTPPATLKVLSGGEALPRELADALLAGGAELWNLYGPTETTVWSTVAKVEREGPITLGRPVANTRVYVLHDDGAPAPVGVPGELCIGGAGVARGYLGRPELTAEKFVPDPFAGGEARMYRTGDRVRWRADGTLEFYGRLDTQVKLRGFRIELGEIESVLREHPGVAEAAALVREDVPGDARLVAYLVAKGAAPPVSELRALLRTKVPEYMVPSAFVTLEALPLTPNGKVDRRALPAPDAAATAPEDTYVAPSTETETQIATIWAELLRRGRVGVNDSFFELGGHSLLATQVMGRIRQTMGASLPVRVLFEARTVAELAKRVDEAKAAPAKGPRLSAASRAAYRVHPQAGD